MNLFVLILASAVTLVTVITALVNYVIFTRILAPAGLEYLSFLVFIFSIAALVQILEIVIERFIPAIYMAFGIFLPLITVNCAILGVSLFMNLREYDLPQTLVFSFGSGVGWLLTVSAMAGLRKYLSLSRPVKLLGEAGITLILAGLLSLTFPGFTGMLTL